MADIPGVSSQPDSTDLAGRPTVGLSADGGFDQLLLDPKTYQVVGMQQVSTGGSAPRTMTSGGGGSGPARGSLISATTIAQLTAVSGPGAR